MRVLDALIAGGDEEAHLLAVARLVVRQRTPHLRVVIPVVGELRRRTAVINKRAGGMGLISGRKAFQRPLKEGVGLLNAIQDVYLNGAITIA